ncbi:MAG: aldo/keto reductase [Bryobacteraceae bacterium]
MSQELSRRQFSRLLATETVAVGAGWSATGLPTRPLGKIGFQASIVGLGAQRIADQPMEQAVVDRLIGEALDNGVNYIDTARGYGDSEDKLGRALAGNRHKVFLVTKTRSATRDAAMRDLEESLRRLRTDCVDCVHIHNIARDDRFSDLEAALSEKGVLGALLEAKKKGMTRRIGCTAHLRPGRVLPVFATGAIELFMCNINFVERHLYNFEERVLPQAVQRASGWPR